MKKAIYIIIILSLIIFAFLFFMKPNMIIYSWKMANLTDDQFNDLLNKWHINVVYQEFNNDYLNGTDNEFIAKLNTSHIAVYHLCGEKEWGKGEGNSLITEINKVIAYNQNNEVTIQGIVFDVETYSLDGDFDTDIYLQKMQEAYSVAKENNLKMVIAIPYWFDKYPEFEENLFATAGDKYSVMNYSNNPVDTIATEVNLANKYHKEINNIIEIDENKSASTNYQSILQTSWLMKLKYPHLKIAIHHYNAINK